MEMQRSRSELWRRVEAQAAETPAIYGGIDFSRMPERFTTAPDGEAVDGFESLVPDILADPDLLETMAAYTLMGDAAADAYAALIPAFGFRRLIDMLTLACERGVEAVADAPPELAALIADMERRPNLLDMDLVNEGARLERNSYAHLVPFAIRGAFLATFMNKYSALPMALTGWRPSGCTRRRPSSPSPSSPARWSASARPSRRRPWCV